MKFKLAVVTGALSGINIGKVVRKIAHNFARDNKWLNLP
jgi:hypothetical protein